jgi:hypothetical protein
VNEATEPAALICESDIESARVTTKSRLLWCNVIPMGTRLGHQFAFHLERQLESRYFHFYEQVALEVGSGGFYKSAEGLAMDLAVRTERSPSSIVPELRRLMQDASPELATSNFTTMDQVVEDSYGSQQLAARLGDVWRVRTTSVRGWNLRIVGIPGNPENERIGPPNCARRPAQRRDVARIAAAYLDAARRVGYRISLGVSLQRSIENIPLWSQAK